MSHGTEIESLQSPMLRHARKPTIREQKSEVRDQTSAIPHQSASSVGASTISNQRSTDCKVALLTGGGDKPYALGLAEALTSEGISFDLIGSDDLEVTERVRNRRTNFLNLQGDRILRYILGLFVMLSGHKRRYFISFGTTSFEPGLST